MVISAISGDFEYGGVKLGRPTPFLVGILVFSALAYFTAVLFAKRTTPTRKVFVWIVLVGLAMRASFFASEPIHEDDYYRYMLDGAVLANGHNPYAYAPEFFLELDESGEQVSPRLAEIAKESREQIDRINHPSLRTIYPMTAQLFFAAAYFIKPFSLVAWRAVLLAVDVSVLLLLAYALRKAGMSILWVLVYWWNPLVVKEIFNSGHMDIIVLPFLLSALILTWRERYELAAICLGLAAGAKIWPIVLLPLIARPLLRKPYRLVLVLFITLAVFAGTMLPAFVAGLESDSGFTAYAQRWEMNDALYMAIEWSAKKALEVTNTYSGTSQVRFYGRLAAGFFVLMTLAWVSLKKADGLDGLFAKALAVVAAIFLLSPTQFPWYYVWMVPLLALSRRASLLSLTFLLPIYYLRFYFDARHNVDVFDNGIVWLEFAPVCCLLLVEWGLSFRKKRKKKSENKITAA